MKTAQEKVGLGVIERVFVQEDNIGVPAFMIGMTADAVLTVDVGYSAVEAPSLLDVSGDLLVTDKAEITLVDAVED